MLDPDNARIYGSDDDKVWVGEIGAVLPTTLDDPTEHEDSGWLGEDGIDLNSTDDVQKFKGHQGGRTVRTKTVTSETAFVFRCLETTALTLGLQFNIKNKTTTGGVTTSTMSSGRKVVARSFVIDLFDENTEGEIQRRLVIPRGEIGERGSLAFKNNEITVYEFTVEIIGDFIEITNDPAVAVPAGG
ncbi:hypothetical protein ACH473_10680 [Cellulosimicrobium funkei]|jgi:hypothetical protein|uniref:phage tail tube protein n=1 Tax=Cellulosimicrobium funkei TaxID=264251 RepID=UPI0037569CC8